MNPIQLQLTIEEVNQILAALGDQPYAKVYQIIQKIHQQAQAQVEVDRVQGNESSNHEG